MFGIRYDALSGLGGLRQLDGLRPSLAYSALSGLQKADENDEAMPIEKSNYIL